MYILHSQKINKFYIGATSDSMEERLRKHNSNHKGFTGRANDWKLVYSEEYNSMVLALKREKEIKKWKSSLRIKKLIAWD